MVKLFGKNTGFYRTIKLYSIGRDQDLIDRPLLIESILKLLKDAFGEYPKVYDIQGSVWNSTVDLESFQSRLSKKGHADYYALVGKTEEKYGFHILLGAKLGSNTYSEVIIWYSLESYSLDFRRAVECLIKPFAATSGFELDLSKTYDITNETQMKKSFGVTTMKVNYKHREWILKVDKGRVRDLFEHNLWNDAQIRYVKSLGIQFSSFDIQGLHMVAFADSSKVNAERRKMHNGATGTDTR